MILQAKQVGVGAPAKRISLRNSTSKASWEFTSNLKEFCPTPIQEVEKALSQMRNETRSMLSESGEENFDDQIIDIVGNPNLIAELKCTSISFDKT
ncbi:hypothetical protein [Staphylococcus borealis]|uniref:Uncharacterized protein n=1 Tax=Staphylococcus borealis TaxID=2742203 RepID=A0ABX2LLA8_9STAP|nr:hypothetical protein [Staphylococcus borealis]MEB6609547.1 hypothetical protein [Staphylococcus borealis]MEB7365602.1 hypothetical protein [Staphylococcus borealis]MEB7460071.1 hypothetical protein [Staphylococcus borealis]MUN92895.1 hypothetical protein [Staphylococcus borealis]NUI80445.1 hypothetical protein [Staphylococcus borealis]